MISTIFTNTTPTCTKGSDWIVRYIAWWTAEWAKGEKRYDCPGRIGYAALGQKVCKFGISTSTVIFVHPIVNRHRTFLKETSATVILTLVNRYLAMGSGPLVLAGTILPRRAMKHVMISSLGFVKNGFMDGYVTKDEYANALLGVEMRWKVIIKAMY